MPPLGQAMGHKSLPSFLYMAECSLAGGAGGAGIVEHMQLDSVSARDRWTSTPRRMRRTSAL
eukprot:2963154-Amphidinium_carterae.1